VINGRGSSLLKEGEGTRFFPTRGQSGKKKKAAFEKGSLAMRKKSVTKMGPRQVKANLREEETHAQGGGQSVRDKKESNLHPQKTPPR